MSTLKEMYKGIPNSPEATLTSDINSTQTTITVSDANIIPEVPNILVIGGNTDNPETVKVTGKNGNTLTVERGFQGVPRSWNAGTIVARNFTEYDYNALVENIKTLKENTDINADNILSLKNNEHTHTNKSVIDKFTEVAGKLYYNGKEIGGAVPNLTLNELTLGGRFKIAYNDIEDSLDIEVI